MSNAGRSRRYCLIVRCALILLLSQAVVAQTLALTGCTLIDPHSGRVAPHTTIVIRGDRITSRKGHLIDKRSLNAMLDRAQTHRLLISQSQIFKNIRPPKSIA